MSIRCTLVSCRGLLVERMDRLGRLHFDCPKCLRRKAGRCQRCPKPVDGTVGMALHCATCRRKHANEQSRRWRIHNADQHRALCRRWQKANNEYNAERARAYRYAKQGKPVPAEKLSHSERGKLGGKLGSAARIKSCGPERVKEIAAKARAARWAKYYAEHPEKKRPKYVAKIQARPTSHRRPS